MTRTPPPAERFESLVRRQPDGCWEWAGRISGYGYAELRGGRSGYRMPAHRFSYEASRGPIPAGLVIDHLNKACVNPDHMEPVTIGENVRRGLLGVRRDTCHRGHLMVPENVYLRPSDGGRRCRTCKRMAHGAFRKRHALPILMVAGS